MDKATVLVVDDEPNVLKIATMVLEKAGYAVIPAVDGMDGLSKFSASKEQISAVLTDVQMPRMDGLKMARSILSASPSLKVVFMSGYAPTDEVSKLVDEWNGAFLAKPFSLTGLVSALT